MEELFHEIVDMNTSQKNEKPSNRPSAEPELPEWVKRLQAVAPVVYFQPDDADDAEGITVPACDGDDDGDDDFVYICTEPIDEADALEIIKKLDAELGRHSKPIPLSPKKAGHRPPNPNWYEAYSSSVWIDADTPIEDLPHVEIQPYGDRQWAVMMDGALLCVCAYQRGALAVKRVITEMGRRYVIEKERAAAQAATDRTNRMDQGNDMEAPISRM